jgi:hypothetical protein
MVERKAYLLLAMLLFAGGCGSGADRVVDERTDAEKQQALRDSAFGGLVDPMDRAATVEQLGIDRKRELDAALDQ